MATDPGQDRAPRDLSERAHQVTETLRATYGPARRGPLGHPTDVLIATILSQNTSDVNSGRAFALLKARYPTWAGLVEAPVEDLIDTIRSAGLANIKGPRILDVLAEVRNRFGTLDLAFLRDLPLPQARRALEGLHGVGPKTVACVLLFACDMPALPVDTHVYRVTSRLGLIPDGTTASAAHDVLEHTVLPPDVYDFHVLLITHGREVCQARRPRCEVCVLQSLCEYFQRRSSTSPG